MNHRYPQPARERPKTLGARRSGPEIPAPGLLPELHGASIMSYDNERAEAIFKRDHRLHASVGVAIIVVLVLFLALFHLLDFVWGPAVLPPIYGAMTTGGILSAGYHHRLQRDRRIRKVVAGVSVGELVRL